MKIVLAAFGSRGDVQPLVALGVRLRAEGHDVVIGASAGFADWVRGYGLGFHTVGRAIEAWIRSHGHLLGRPARMMARAMEYVREDVAISFEQTLAAARGADMLVAGIHAAAPSVAEALRLPYRTLLFCPQVLPSRHHPPLGVPWFELPRVCNRLLWWALGGGFGLVLRDAINRGRRSLGLAPVADVMAYLVTERPIVASDRLLGALPPDVGPWITQTGSLALPADGALDPALERFLSAGEPPIYIGFGSMPNADPPRTTRTLVAALEASGRRGVILSGWAGLGEEGVPSSVYVAHSAPHALLLPRVALAVHHGGAGTTAAAARAGIPQIVVPHVADQFYWGHRIWACGLGGRPLSRHRLTAATLSRAIRGVLSRPENAARARAAQGVLASTDGVSALTRLLDQAAEAPARRTAA